MHEQNSIRSEGQKREAEGIFKLTLASAGLMPLEANKGEVSNHHPGKKMLGARLEGEDRFEMIGGKTEIIGGANVNP